MRALARTTSDGQLRKVQSINLYSETIHVLRAAQSRTRPVISFSLRKNSFFGSSRFVSSLHPWKCAVERRVEMSNGYISGASACSTDAGRSTRTSEGTRLASRVDVYYDAGLARAAVLEVL